MKTVELRAAAERLEKLHMRFAPLFGRVESQGHSESVATLPGVVIDTLNVLPYFPGPNHTTEGGHVGTGRISSGSYRGNHSC